MSERVFERANQRYGERVFERANQRYGERIFERANQRYGALAHRCTTATSDPSHESMVHQ